MSCDWILHTDKWIINVHATCWIESHQIKYNNSSAGLGWHNYLRSYIYRSTAYRFLWGTGVMLSEDEAATMCHLLWWAWVGFGSHAYFECRLQISLLKGNWSLRLFKEKVLFLTASLYESCSLWTRRIHAWSSARVQQYSVSVAFSFFVPRLTADTIHGTDTVAFVMLAYATHYAALQLHT